jgi:hypothetical protein
MDGKKVQFSHTGGGQKVPIEIRSSAAQGPRMTGGHGYEMSVAEGHYRCPHCRPADLQEKDATATRMR